MSYLLSIVQKYGIIRRKFIYFYVMIPMVTIKRKPDFARQMYEKEAWAQNELICGIDEVGRSCLAGPVVAAAAILKPHVKHKYLKDSKLLTPEERLIAYKWLMKNCDWAVGITHHRIIDSINIYQATLCAMKRALMQLFAQSDKRPSFILVDAMPVSLDHSDIPVIHFPFGERQSTSIAAASIIAKVTRDALMARLDTILPGYVFETNKGYGTAVHKKALKEQGTSVIHRESFKWQREKTPPQEVL
jgi:ribonuclease HII